jgi:predicted nucleic acid-binding protein
MKYVLDSSVALKWVLAESDSVKAVRLRGEYVSGLHEFHAPDIFASEIANALVFAERQGRIQSGESVIFQRCAQHGAKTSLVAASAGSSRRDGARREASRLRLHLSRPRRARRMRTAHRR